MARNDTVMMKRYKELKENLTNCVGVELPNKTLLMMKVGDFYELMYEDAEIAATTLGRMTVLRYAKGEEPVPMMGFPYHQLTGYILKLTQAGYNVAVDDDGRMMFFAVEGNTLVEYSPGRVRAMLKGGE